MPIEINRKNIECPNCKNQTIFDIGKKYVCGRCMCDINKETMQVTITIKEITEDVVIPLKSASEINIVEKMERDEKLHEQDTIIDPQIIAENPQM